ncbi:proteasome activator pa28 REG alpha beta subunit [Fomitopsis serialis]|uniref:proteasome activator pa28 REG alpha beta subunit n=1 Tax=Fomitopsis serialis TaxID=139415 RepID=UPI002007801A|nr:proteasome activator pa28 REG alpha beta subunit [Neoantrodia serialis]KAH9937379.1 proteasome activator pa28 REG alpha beta subunit [Neoantrodia serialis]
MSGKSSMDKETTKKIEEFQSAASVVAENVVFRIFPCKILEIQQLIDSTNDSSSQFHTSHAATSTNPTVYPPPNSTEEGPDVKKRKLHSSDANGVVSMGLTAANDIHHAVYPNLVKSNQHIDNVHTVVKRECEQLADLCDKVKLWVNLSMPKIEDGDNFGVQIQEEVLTELHRSQESAFNIRDAGRLDHLNRAKICSKIVKYPHIEDYTLALKEHDEKQLYVARQNLHDLRNVYAILTDILHKNIAKIRSPKGNNTSGMY